MYEASGVISHVFQVSHAAGGLKSHAIVGRLVVPCQYFLSLESYCDYHGSARFRHVQHVPKYDIFRANIMFAQKMSYWHLTSFVKSVDALSAFLNLCNVKLGFRKAYFRVRWTVMGTLIPSFQLGSGRMAG